MNEYLWDAKHLATTLRHHPQDGKM